jgi:hypothetical protein
MTPTTPTRLRLRRAETIGIILGEQSTPGQSLSGRIESWTEGCPAVFRRSGDGDFGYFAEFKAEVEAKAVAEAKFDGGVAQGAEAVHFGGEVVLAGWKGEELELAGGWRFELGDCSGGDSVKGH